MRIIKNNKSLIAAIFLIILSFQFFNYLIEEMEEEIIYFENCSVTFSEELVNDEEAGFNNSFVVMYERVPVFPEFSNIKCINKVIGKSFDKNDSETTYYVGYSQMIFMLQGIFFIIFVSLLVKFFKKLSFLEFLFLLNVFLFFQFYGLPIYILFTQIIKLNILAITCNIFIYNFNQIRSKRIFDSEIKAKNYSLILFLFSNISLFIFFEHMKNFNYKNYFIHFSSWSINYTGGINRRGLMGELITLVPPNFDIKLVVAVVISIIYLLILYNILNIFLITRQNYISVIMTISPFYLLFVINDFRGGNSKEIIGFLAFTLLILYNIRKDGYLIYASLLMYIVAIYSHSVNVFIFPFIIFYIYKISDIKRKSLLYIAYSLCLLSLVSFVFSPLMLNSYFDQDIWCLNLIQNFSLSHTCADLLNGNMLDLKVNGDFLDNIGYTFERINLMTFLNFGILFFIGNSYFLKTKFFSVNFKELIIVYISLLPLFVVALDWGRWLYILFFCLFTIYISYPNKNKDSRNLIKTYTLLALPTFILYVPHCCADTSLRNIISYNLDTFHLFDFIFKIYSF